VSKLQHYGGVSQPRSIECYRAPHRDSGKALMDVAVVHIWTHLFD